MCGKERVKRYAVLLAGLLICAFGVALITKASLGTSPSVAISYSLSLVFENISLGTWLVIYQAALITAEIIMLRRLALCLNASCSVCARAQLSLP
ncbi:MAG: DUF6198 family protein [Oscillospiraceae bacterium]|nr:DUF6198 family protein [Oscillospiraceae bacterium]